MGYKKQCISQQMISTNSSVPEGFIAHVLIEMIDPLKLFLVNINVLVIHGVEFWGFFFFTKYY